MAELATTSSIRDEKARRVTEVQEKLKSAKMAIVTDYRGLTVAQITRLRREIREASGEYQVIKNTLARRALKDTVYGALDTLLEGTNGWVFAYEDPVTLSKAVVKFVEENEKLAIKGGVLDGEYLDQAKVKVLAQMPSRTELQAKLLALMQAPAVQLLRLIQEPGARVVRILETLRKGRESESALSDQQSPPEADQPLAEATPLRAES
ncbi:MAG: 50S ribosomal protein L10 [Deltaproteobacteria bacterium]|nr:50S ribosomal protein L10 [Deltaproteobacteria bacterium]